MNDSSDIDFPEYFGDSPDDFLEKYIRLIYKIIQDYKDSLKGKHIDVKDIFQDFFIHIQKNNFEKLRKYDPQYKTKPSFYLGIILKNFIKDKLKLKKSDPIIISIDEIKMDIDISVHSEHDYMISESIKNAFKETFSKMSNQAKLIFDLTYEYERYAKDIADLLGKEVDQIYVSNRKNKKILLENLKKRGIIIKKKKKTDQNFNANSYI